MFAEVGTLYGLWNSIVLALTRLWSAESVGHDKYINRKQNRVHVP